MIHMPTTTSTGHAEPFHLWEADLAAAEHFPDEEILECVFRRDGRNEWPSYLDDKRIEACMDDLAKLRPIGPEWRGSRRPLDDGRSDLETARKVLEEEVKRMVFPHELLGFVHQHRAVRKRKNLWVKIAFSLSFSALVVIIRTAL
jgi:hypothetical protein